MDSYEGSSVYCRIDDQPTFSEKMSFVDTAQSIARGKINSCVHGESPMRSTWGDTGSASVGQAHQNCNARIGGLEDSVYRSVRTKPRAASVPLDKEESRCNYNSLDDFLHGSFSSSCPTDFEQMKQAQQWQMEENVVPGGCLGQRNGNVRQQKSGRVVGDHGDVHYSHLPNRPRVSQITAIDCESQRGVFAALRRWTQKRATIVGVPMFHRDPNEPSTCPYGHLDDGSTLSPSRLSGRDTGTTGSDRSDDALPMFRATMQENHSRSSDHSQAMPHSHIDWALGVHEGDDVHALPSVCIWRAVSKVLTEDLWRDVP
eukprot:TRINITY_DN1544_c0_g1_i1.p1 TRINITY_DN1544_c0_g1~~TRINITY_DN1544_c0_g1_i1.p1  ORF type:complete len:358 (+),score=25.40 TRINITY_DN1544_c0_g1_i1:130-1074(+)